LPQSTHHDRSRTDSRYFSKVTGKRRNKIHKSQCLTKGFTGEQFEKAYEEAQLQSQLQADKDPTIRLFLGPTLLIVAGVTFYTNYHGRFWGVSTVIGLVVLYYGLMMVWSLVKQWQGKK
jgi:hypothetical protein